MAYAPARSEGVTGCWVAPFAELRDVVVLADEQDRKRPDRGKVHRFVERALGHGSVAEVRHGHVAVAASTRRKAGSDCDREPGADDAVGTEHTDACVGDVHRAAHTATEPGLTTHELGEHSGHIGALGEDVAMPPMRRRDDIGRA